MKGLRPWRILQSQRVETDWDDLLTGNKPVVMFIGGLLHLNETQNTPTLFERLSLLVGPEKVDGDIIRLSMVSERTRKPVGANWTSYRAFNEAGKVSSHARNLVDNLILPRSVVSSLSGDVLSEAVARHTSRLNVIAYSVGTSLIRQVEDLSIRRLQEAGLATDQIAHALNPLMVFNMGPASPLCKGEKGFVHLYSLLEGDAVSKEANDWTSYMQGLRCTGIKATRTGLSLFVSDGAGDTQERGIKYIPSEFETIPGSYKVLLKHNGEGHSIFLYTNLREAAADGTTMTYPSMPSAALNRSYIDLMIDGSVRACREGAIRDSLRAMSDFKDACLSPAVTAQLIARYHEDRAEFEETILSHDPGRSSDLLRQRLSELSRSSRTSMDHTYPAGQAMRPSPKK